MARQFYRVTGTPFITACIHCKRPLTAGNASEAYADPQGPAFEAYYHRDCALEVGATLAEQVPA